MKIVLAPLLLFYLSLSIIAPSLNLFFPDVAEHNVTYLNAETDSEIDEKEKDHQILLEIRTAVTSDFSNFYRLFYFDQNLYVSVDQKYFGPPPEAK